MISKTIGKCDFSLLKGQITKDSCKETIKKLMIASDKQFTQIIPACLVAGKNHIFSALEQSLSAFEQKTNFTKKPELEFIVRLLANKQLNKALEKAEFRQGEILVLVIGSSDKKTIEKVKTGLNFVEKEFALGKNEKELKEFFGISEEELSALNDVEKPLEELVIERVAFVSLER